MIVVDTSALMAILLREPQAEACRTALLDADEMLMSAGTLSEALIVAGNRKLGAQMAALVEQLDFQIESVTIQTTQSVSRAYESWGKGRHAAALNFGDCFASVLARERACRLLFVGDDFSKTDISSALG